MLRYIIGFLFLAILICGYILMYMSQEKGGVHPTRLQRLMKRIFD